MSDTPKITQISKEDLKAAKECMEASGLLGAHASGPEVKSKAIGAAASAPAPTKLEMENAQTVGMAIIEQGSKAHIRLIQAAMTADGLKMQELSQEVTGDDLKNALSCSVPKVGRSR